MGVTSSSGSSSTRSRKYVTGECHLTEESGLKLPVGKASIISNNFYRLNDEYIDQWNDKRIEIIWDVKFENAGPLHVTLGLATDKQHAGAKIEIEVEKTKMVIVSKNTGGYHKVKSFKAGSATLKTSGLHTIRVRILEFRNNCAGHLHHLFLSGAAAKDACLQEIPNRIDTVALRWDPGSTCEIFYMEMTVTDTVRGAIFVACGFNSGYFGVRDNEFSNRRGVVFCVHDPVSRKDKLLSPTATLFPRVTSLEHARNVGVEKFGYSGNGMQSFYGYYWNRNETYRFLLVADANEEQQSVVYSAFFYRNEIRKWKKLASFKVVYDGKPMHLLFSSIEDYLGNQGRFCRRASFGPGWVRKSTGEWQGLTRASFTQSGYLKNTSAEVNSENKFDLCTGGNIKQCPSVGEWLVGVKNGDLPNVIGEKELCSLTASAKSKEKTKS